MVDKLKYLVVDVDGTMTDSGIYYDEHGNEMKKFSTRDAAGFFAAHYANIKIIIITGRKCAATEKRTSELKADYVFQNIKNKFEFLEAFMRDNSISKDEIGYIGDDLNDLKSMMLTGFKACPADGCSEIKSIADYVSSVNGGYGAVRDIIEYILKNTGMWDEAIADIYDAGL